MPPLNEHQDVSLVTVILPRQSTNAIIAKALKGGVRHVLVTNARGTLVKDHWYQKLLPAISPEQEVIQVLVEKDHVDDIIRNFVFAGELYRSGAGAIYSTTCDHAWLPGSFLHTSVERIGKADTRFLPLKPDLVSINCICSQENSNAIARAAVNTGAPGPTIRYCRGEGVRARMGLLRVAISPDKELLQAMVNAVDAETIFEAMIVAGGLDSPGAGFIYMTPVDKGLSNISTTYGGSPRAASIEQIVQAIDDLKGDTDWRAHTIYNKGDRRGRTLKKRTYLTRLVCLRLITEGGTSNAFVKAALRAGAPGVSITFGREVGQQDTEVGKTGVRLTREKEVVESILSPRIYHQVFDAYMAEAEKTPENEIALYTQQVPKAFTYLG